MDESSPERNSHVVEGSPSGNASDRTPKRKRDDEDEDGTPVGRRDDDNENNQNKTRYDSEEDQEEQDYQDEDFEPPQPKERIQASLGFLTGCRSVDNFARLNRVEEGSYGVVFRGRDKQTGEIVALKKVKMDREKEGFPITSLREIFIMMSFKHPNVVDVKEIVVGNELDSIFIVMEFLEHDLKDLMGEMKDDTRFLTSEVKCLMLQLLSGVAHLHENWIIHRDLKSSNLLYSNKGLLKIADFGMAREYGSPIKPYTNYVVTLWYRAPELLLGTKTYTPAVDMWSVGCIFAEIITKEPLIPGRSELDQLDKMFKLLGSPNTTIWPGLSELPNAKKINFANQPYNLLRQRIPTITSSCADLISKMLTYDPEKRISAAEALQHPFFQESPRAKDPSMMPTWPSSHDGTKKMRRSSLEEDQMKERILMEAKADDERFGRSQSYGFRLRI